MANLVDNLIAFRILSGLVTPFDKTKAFEHGVINANGDIIVKEKDRNTKQKASYDMLDRLIFSLKRLLGKIPGGKSKISSLAAAYYLVKEAYESNTTLNEHRAKNLISLANNSVVLAEEQLIVENFLNVIEEMGSGAVNGSNGVSTNSIANKAGTSVSTDIPTIKLGVKKKKTPIAVRSNPIQLGK
jgi:hypothetical protein